MFNPVERLEGLGIVAFASPKIYASIVIACDEMTERRRVNYLDCSSQGQVSEPWEQPKKICFHVKVRKSNQRFICV